MWFFAKATQIMLDWTVIANLGSAGAVIGVVILFLRFLGEERKNRDKWETARNKSQEQIAGGFREQQKQITQAMQKCIEDNTKALADTHQAMGRVAEAIGRLECRAYPPNKD